MIELKNILKERILQILGPKYPISMHDLDISYPPDIQMGDLALSFPFKLAKTLKQSPRTIAQQMAPLLCSLEHIHKVEIAGGGYINLFLSRDRFFLNQLEKSEETSLSADETKVIVEHTSINPNKAAHIGHLRNSCLGDTLVRCQQYKGEQVEVQNYIDDTGVQVADVVFGFLEIEKKNLKEIQKIKGRFDHYCWDLYTQTTRFLRDNPEAQDRKADILKNIELGKKPESDVALYVSRQILKAHLRTMKRLGVSYDLLACESDIIILKFWESAFNLLKDKNAAYFVDSGKHKGCWVIKLEGKAEQEKILVRSNHTVTYVGKDIAYQLWKFGLLDADFFYEPFIQQNSQTVWITSSHKTHHKKDFGKASRVYNVIDARQAYPQQVVTQGLKSLKFKEQAEKSVHFSYEMVALSPKSLQELGYNVSEEEQDKDFLEVSGRKGLGIKADDLMDRLEQKALNEVEQRNSDWPAPKKAQTATDIACGALRYFMLKFARNSIIVFDFEDVLSFEGETGPYLQYTLVRINSIFNKLGIKKHAEKESLRSDILSQSLSLNSLPANEQDDYWDLVLHGSQLDEEVLHSTRTLEFLHLAKYTFNLCQKFNAYYHKYSVIQEKDEKIRNLRILIIGYIYNILQKALDLMGIPQPKQM
ncbi:MAG: arginine--tRNA ligase [Candidatus Aminicenantes bacterium]|nr:arginine--tRNA ligase [Candidatus Aminicenantes bacterium]